MSKNNSGMFSGTKGHVASIVSSLPSNPMDLLDQGWNDISHPNARKAGHFLLQEKSSGLIIRFDKGNPNKPGYRGVDHYHIYNPNATSAKDQYLDKNGNPVGRNTNESHILPNGGK